MPLNIRLSVPRNTVSAPLHRFGARAQAGIARVVERSIRQMDADLRAESPVGVDRPGARLRARARKPDLYPKLARSWEQILLVSRQPLVGIVGTPVFYARFYEFGTRQQPPRPLVARIVERYEDSVISGMQRAIAEADA